MKDQSYGVIPFFRQQHQAQPQIQYLIIHHVKSHWAFPKGHREGEETPIETALRELSEETQLEIKQLFDQPPFYEHYIFIDPQGQKIDKTVTYFLAEVRDQEVVVQQSEIIEYAWLTYEKAIKQITFEEGRQLLTQADQYLQTQYH